MPDQPIPPGPVCGQTMPSGRTCVSAPGHADRCRSTRPARRQRDRRLAVVPGQLPGMWAARGACRTAADPDLWFADDPGDQVAAVAICRSCPVRALCGTWALDTGQLYGIWGGLTETDRRRARRGQRAAS